jgi:hypothetical protein
MIGGKSILSPFLKRNDLGNNGTIGHIEGAGYEERSFYSEITMGFWDGLDV